MRKSKLGFLVGVTFVLLLGVLPAQAIGRIDETRTELKKQDMWALPTYVEGVVEDDLYREPSADQMFSWAVDNEPWTSEFLTQLRESSIEIDEQIDKWLGNRVLIVFIDFRTYTPYAAVFSLEDGSVTPGFEDTKTEVWASLEFIQEFLVFARDNVYVDVVNYLGDNYYENWAAWAEISIGKAVFDILVSRETVVGLIGWSAAVGTGYYVWNKKK